MVQDLHRPVLLNPQLPDDHVVHTARRVGPGVGLIVSVRGQKTNESESTADTATQTRAADGIEP